MKPKLPSGLVALSTAAVLTVYTAGFLKTRAAAAKIAQTDDRPRPPVPAPAVVSPPSLAVQPPTAPVAQVTPPRRATQARHVKVPAEPTTARAEVNTGFAVTAPASASTATTPAQPSPLAPSPLAPSPPVPSPPSPLPLAPSPPPAPSPPSQYKDGAYTGWGTSRHGDIEATVVIENGKIASARISQCLTRYSCSVIARIIPQVVERQGPDVDYVSGATQSANAFYYAVLEALIKAKQL
jgi:uncharacterized protein with FMN-binding domain